jgi:serine protease
MRIITSSPSADAGVHYVILVEDNGDTVAGLLDVVTVDNGAYSYSINAIPPGQYRVFAGTDSDDDNFLCDDGEACGTYGTLDSPDTVTIDGVDLTEVDFTSEFRVNLNVQNESTGIADQNTSAAEPTPKLIRKPRQ